MTQTECPFEHDTSQAARLFGELNRLQLVWGRFHANMPVRRGEMWLLGAILQLTFQEGKPVTVGQLAKHTHLSMPGISQKLSELEKQGLVSRTPSPEDRRQVYLEVTEKGQKTAEGPLREFLAQMEKALLEMGCDKSEQLISLIHQFSDAIQNLQQNERSGVQ